MQMLPSSNTDEISVIDEARNVSGECSVDDDEIKERLEQNEARKITLDVGPKMENKLDTDTGPNCVVDDGRIEEAPWSVWTPREKRFIIITASVAAFFSPISAQIYLPALVPLAVDLKVSYSLINLSVTTYLV